MKPQPPPGPLTPALDHYQQAVVAHVAGGGGHAVVEAVAGSGKSTLLLALAGALARQRRRVLIACFDKKTQERMQHKVARANLRGVAVKTSHSYGNALVTRSRGKLVLDDRRARKLVQQATPGWSREDRAVVGRAVGLAKTWLVEQPEVLARMLTRYGLLTVRHPPAELAAVVAEVLAATRAPSSTIAYDDMVWLPVVEQMAPEAFDAVLIDEAQDLTRVQQVLLARALGPGGVAVVVGDPRQALYSFRGADPTSMDRFARTLGATRLPLSVCYRCPTSVLRLAREFVPTIEPRPDAPAGVVGWCDPAAVDWRPGDLVLSRTNAPLVAACLDAMRRGIPAEIAGRSGFEERMRELIYAYEGADIEGFERYVRSWMDRQRGLLAEEEDAPRLAEALDLGETLLQLAELSPNVAGLGTRIDALFTPEPAGGRLLFSTVHRAKGSEAPRVWLLEDTLRRNASQEEDNICYVAVTRAQQALVRVGDERDVEHKNEERARRARHREYGT